MIDDKITEAWARYHGPPLPGDDEIPQAPPAYARGYRDGVASVAGNWPKLDKPARVGGSTYGIGISARFVVERAQREYEYYKEDEALTLEQRASLERARRRLWDIINGPLD